MILYTATITAMTGEVIVKQYDNELSAYRAVNYYLKKFDKLNIGAWGRTEKVIA